MNNAKNTRLIGLLKQNVEIFWNDQIILENYLAIVCICKLISKKKIKLLKLIFR